MRVLVVSAAELGVKHAVRNLLRELATRGVEATYLTIPRHDAPEGVARETLLDERLVEGLEGKQLPYLGYAILNFWRRAYERVAEVGEEYDAVWYHTPRLLPLAPRGVAPKTLVTYHNHLRGWKADNHGPPASLYYRLFAGVEDRGIRRLADAGGRFTVVYDAVREEVEAAGAPRNRVSYVGNGVNLERFTPEGERVEPAALAGSEGGTEPEPASVSPAARADGAGGGGDGAGATFLSLGSLTEQKRPLALVECFERLQAESGEHHRLFVAGDGPLRERAAARAEGVPGVTFLGFVAEDTKPKLYRSVDYFVLASRYEGEPLALYEALASGTPAVTADIPNLRFVESAACGAVADFDDPAGAAERVGAYLDGDTETHGENARMYAQRNLSWGAAADEYHATLADIGGGS
jgi:glycosyltransferase involved in cell wall biosynthesis